MVIFHLSRNQTKTLLGIETNADGEEVGEKQSRNQTKTLLGIETIGMGTGNRSLYAAIKLKPY